MNSASSPNLEILSGETWQDALFKGAGIWHRARLLELAKNFMESEIEVKAVNDWLAKCPKSYEETKKYFLKRNHHIEVKEVYTNITGVS